MRIDLNCDLGEGCPYDAELMPLITSANISCGAHAGDPDTMHAALTAARLQGVQVGAHPGFADRAHFGRRELERSAEGVFRDGVYQVAGLWGLARAVGLEVRYLKPHGALYHLACRDTAFARPLARVAQFFGLPMMGLPQSVLQQVVEGQGAERFIAEGFADRRYSRDGSLVPRSQPEAMIDDPQEAVEQVAWLIRERGVQTICVHGDNPRAVEFVLRLREFLDQAGFHFQAFDR